MDKQEINVTESRGLARLIEGTLGFGYSMYFNLRKWGYDILRIGYNIKDVMGTDYIERVRIRWMPEKKEERFRRRGSMEHERRSSDWKGGSRERDNRFGDGRSNDRRGDSRGGDKRGNSSFGDRRGSDRRFSGGRDSRSFGSRGRDDRGGFKGRDDRRGNRKR